MSLSVLVIDDEPAIRECLVYYLTASGFHTFSAANGELGFQCLDQESNIDLIILDLQMPILNGYSFLERKKNLANIKDIPVIIFSSDQNITDLTGENSVIGVLPKTTEFQDIVAFVGALKDSNYFSI